MTTAFDEANQRINRGASPYVNLPKREPNFFSFLGDATYLAQAIEKYRPRFVIEVGSLLGASAIFMAEKMRDLKLDACVICVDTWLAEKTLWGMDEHRGKMYFENARPQTYTVFLNNIVAKGLQDYVCPLSMDSRSGARWLAQVGISAPVIYIDGCHETPDVYHDLTLYYDRLQSSGTMVIDDYQSGFADLVKDVDRFVKERALQLESANCKARFVKP